MARERKKNILQRLTEGNGFYAVMMVCLVAVGATGIAMAKTARDLQQAQIAADAMKTEISRAAESEATPTPQVSPQPVPESTAPAPEVPRPAPESIAPAPQPSIAPDEPVMAESALYLPPVTGGKVRDYSGSGLIYDETMQDYRSHLAVDFAGQTGDTVTAVEHGIVERVAEDPLWGNVVVIDHENGMKSLYANLGEIWVEPGQNVSRYDTIGTIGVSARCESKMQSHLHFAMEENGVAVDPNEYLEYDKAVLAT